MPVRRLVQMLLLPAAVLLGSQPLIAQSPDFPTLPDSAKDLTHVREVRIRLKNRPDEWTPASVRHSVDNCTLLQFTDSTTRTGTRVALIRELLALQVEVVLDGSYYWQNAALSSLIIREPEPCRARSLAPRSPAAP